jgi:hypothetical protein
MAGSQVIMYGRIWVFTKGTAKRGVYRRTPVSEERIKSLLRKRRR